MKNKIIFYLIAIVICFQCDFRQEKKKNLPIFEAIGSDKTGIKFVNLMQESPSQNVLTYEYYYNGAGVAIADFNNDGKPDIFLTSCLESNTLYLNNGNFKFKDITQKSGLVDSKGFSTGVTTVDINNDGLMDIYICKSGRFQNPKSRENLLYVNQGTNEGGIPFFKESASKYGLNISSYSTQAAFFDYNRDGQLDMFLISHGIDTYDDNEIESLRDAQDTSFGERLFKNNNGQFVDVTNDAGIIQNKLGYGLGVGISDLNNDGWPDVYVSNDYSGKDHLYMNQQDGSFLEGIDQSTGHISFYSMGNDLADINNDGLTDIAVLDMAGDTNFDIKTSMSAMNPNQFHALEELGQHKQYMYNTLLINQGSGFDSLYPKFSDVAQMTGIASTDWSWGPLLFDFDNDGFKDIFITNGIKRNIRNNDALKLVSSLNEKLTKAQSKNEMSNLFKEALDVFPRGSKPNYFFHNRDHLNFQNISADIGADTLLTNSNGAAYGDLDGDGDMDLVINNVNQEALLYRNNSRESSNNGYLQIKAKGPSGNLNAIGLKVTIKYNGQLQTSELYTTRGYLSSVAPLVHFGLGNVKEIDTLTLLWPDGKNQELRNVDINQLLKVDYANSSFRKRISKTENIVFKDVTELFSSIERPIENMYDDFKNESLLPHKMSQTGPALSIADINNDGLDDFFIGGATSFKARTYIQDTDGSFKEMKMPVWIKDAVYEDSAALFMDFDGDGNQDLIVGSGGNEFPDSPAQYPLRFYKNNGSGQLIRLLTDVPKIFESVGVLSAGDFDQDGDLDLFVGGRQIPGKYPYPANSYILKNDSSENGIKFIDSTEKAAPFLNAYGLVTDATWADFNSDGVLDLATVGEWMSPNILINENGIFRNTKNSSNMSDIVGWWFALESYDIDSDGDQDLIGGNLGLNYKYKASKEEPFTIYTHDFDDNGTQDIVLSYIDNGKMVPLRGRQCSSRQMPFIASKFPSYASFGEASIHDVFPSKILEEALEYEATSFGHAIFINDGQGRFEHQPLPRMSQVSSVNDILIDDFTKDGIPDILLAGNLLGSEVETPVNDASFGTLLMGLGNGKFEYLPSKKTGLYISGETKHLKKITLGNAKNPYILVIRNNKKPILLSY